MKVIWKSTVLACLAAIAAAGGCASQGSTATPQPAPEPQAVEREPAPAQTRQTASRFSYEPRVGENQISNGLAFPTGDEQTSALLLHTVMPAQINRGSRFETQYHVTNITTGTLQNVVLNLDNYYWKSAPLVIRAIERLHRLGPDAPLAGKGTDTSHPEFYSRRLYRVPGNLQMIRLLIRYLGRYGRTRLSNLLYRDQWTLLFVLKSLENSSPDMRKFQRIVPPRDRFWADPHLLEKNDRCYVFFEELIFEDGRGTIAFVEIDQSGPVSAPQVVLERPYHLSYPHLVEHDGELYMIPETAENHTVELYRCTAFPDKWEHEIDLIAGIDAVDATVIEHDGTWWIFATVIENPGVASTDELHLFYSDEFPSANWTAHPLNPVISDVRRARPAGRLFTKDGRLYRPSQDSSGRYGRAVNINLVTTLSRTDYAEEVVSRIEPEWAKDVRGVHTLSIGDRIMLSDAEIRRPRYWT